MVRGGKGQEKLVERVNALTHDELHVAFPWICKEMNLTQAEIQERTGNERLKLSLLYPQSLTISAGDVKIDACFELIRASSADDYRASEIKWSPAKKRAEMILPDMRYILLSNPLRNTDAALDEAPAEIAGFVSYMVTYEDGHEVLYVYEIHLALQYRGLGIGESLMKLVELVGQQIGLEKCMLTVFRANKRALSWYIRLGFTEDEFSPRSKVLRTGRVRMPSYVILSKSLQVEVEGAGLMISPPKSLGK